MSGEPVLALSERDRGRITEVELLAAGPNAAAALVERLDEPSWPVRRAVVAALARLGQPAVPALIEALARWRDVEARIAATVDALVALQGAPEEALIGLGRTASPPVLADVAQILGRRRAVGTVDALAEWVHHPDDNVAVAAIEALGRIGGDAGIEAVIDAATSGSFFRVFPAVDVLARSADPRALPPLAALLSDPVCGPEAARALGRRGEPDAVPALAAQLCARADSSVRVAAVALADIADRQGDRFGTTEAVAHAVRSAMEPGDAGAPSVTTVATARRLAHALAGADANERPAVCRVLGWLGDAVAAATLTEVLVDDDPAVVEAAAQALSRLGGSAAGEVVAALREADSRRRAMLLRWVPARPEIAAGVVPCLDDPDPDVRALACDVLARAGSVEAVPALFQLLDDEDAKVIQAASNAIGALGHAETETLALRAAASPSVRVRRVATRLLGYFGWASALPALLANLEDPDERVRHAAIASLASVEDPRAVQAILDVASSGPPAVRAAATRALGLTAADPAVVAGLEARLADPDPWVRYYACQALGRLEAVDSLEHLVRHLDDEAGQVRIAVIDALARLSDPRATDALIVAASSPDLDLRRAALLGLGQARPAEGLAAVLDAASGSDPATRVVALSALVAFQGAAIERTLAAAVADPDPTIRGTALGALSARPGAAATIALIELLAEPDLRADALEALSRHVEGRIPGILAVLETGGADPQALVAALARMGRPDACAALGVAVAMDRVPARRAAAAALTAVCSDVARAFLAVAAGDVDPEVRRLAALATGGR